MPIRNVCALQHMAQAPRAEMELAPADLEHQFSALLGRRVLHNIRKTDDRPPQISIIDVVVVITGQDANNAALVFRRTKERHPEVNASCADFKFPGRRRRDAC